MRAHQPAERTNRGKGCFIRLASSADHLADIQHASAKLNAGAAAPHIRRERDSVGIQLPGTEGRGARAHAPRMGQRSIERGRIPWHDPVGYKATPFEVAVGALPCVAENEAKPIERTVPAKLDPLDGSGRRGELDGERVLSHAGDHRDAVTPPAITGGPAKLLAASCELDTHAVRSPADIEEGAGLVTTVGVACHGSLCGGPANRQGHAQCGGSARLEKVSA